jgi:cytochrome c556
LLGNEIPHEGDTRRHTASLLANAMMFDGLFPAGSAGATSNARGEIWGNSEEFRAQMRAFQDAARTLDQEVANNQGRSVTMPRLQMVIQTCGSCHATFKLPAPLPF